MQSLRFSPLYPSTKIFLSGFFVRPRFAPDSFSLYRDFSSRRHEIFLSRRCFFSGLLFDLFYILHPVLRSMLRLFIFAGLNRNEYATCGLAGLICLCGPHGKLNELVSQLAAFTGFLHVAFGVSAACGKTFPCRAECNLGTAAVCLPIAQAVCDASVGRERPASGTVDTFANHIE